MDEQSGETEEVMGEGISMMESCGGQCVRLRRGVQYFSQ